MTAADLAALEVPGAESDPVRCWRLEELCRAGYDEEDATEIAFHLDEEVGIRESQAIADRRPEHLGIRAPADLHRLPFAFALPAAGLLFTGARRTAFVRTVASSGPITAPVKP